MENDFEVCLLNETATRFLFASFLCSYPPDDFLASVQEFRAYPCMTSFSALSSAFDVMQAEPNKIEDMRSKYIELFDRGRSENPLYESEYGQGRSFAKGNDLVDISGFYRAFGFMHGQEGSTVEMPDHIAMQLEFYALMCMKEAALQKRKDKEGKEIVQEARKKFLESHLGRFARVIALRPLVANDSYFGLVFSCAADLVEEACQGLGVRPSNPEWYGSESEEEQMLCGGLNQNTNAPSLVQIG